MTLSLEGRSAARGHSVGHSVPAFIPCCLMSSKMVTVNEKCEIPPSYFVIATNLLFM